MRYAPQKPINKAILSLILAVMLVATLVVPTVVEAEMWNAENVTRIWGANRFDTAFAVADALMEQKDGNKFTSVLIASGKNFPDALSGSYLAAVRESPILMAGNKNDENLISYIHRNLEAEGTIYILGGTNAVSEDLEKAFSEYQVKRLQGDNRIGTNLEVLKEAGVSGGEILVCTALDFADSLSASATGHPILLVNNRTGELTKEQTELIASWKDVRFCIVGGEKAVSTNFENQLVEFGAVRRIGGSSRLETSVMLAEAFFQEPKSATLAYAKDFPDGLCGGLLARSLGGPVMLTMTGKATQAAEYAQKNELYGGAVLGGSKRIDDDTVRKVFAMDSNAPILSFGGEAYNITYELKDGENHPANPLTYHSGTAILLQVPSRENYDFAGWYLDAQYNKPITEISSDMAGDITVYARWTLKALNRNGEGLEDMIWSWWYYPQVFSTRDAVFWGYAAHDGYCGIARYDQVTGVVTKTDLKLSNTADDHNGLGLTVMDDGKIMCVYAGGHNSDNDIHIRISNEPGNIEKFDTHIVLRSYGKTCYGQILKYNGKYHIFYRINNNSWGTRSSADGVNWSKETTLVTSNTQYYCRFMPTTQDGLIRVCMCSNPTATDPRIRMGFLNLDTGELLNADGTTVVGTNNVSYTSFDVLITPPEGKIQRMFDVAITAPEEPRILYTVFSKQSGSDDSTYYLYDSGSSHWICDGGVPLWDPKYQLGASFADADTIVAGRNEAGTDYIEIYSYDGAQVKKDRVLDTQSGTAWERNGRPIVDVNGRAVLWHNGYYNPKVYTDFLTDARLCLLEQNIVVRETQAGMDPEKLAQVSQQNKQEVAEYAAALYEANIQDDYARGSFTWDGAKRNSNWIYFTGLVYEGFLEIDMNAYSAQVRDFLNQHITQDGKIPKYIDGELDSALIPAVMLKLLNEGDLTLEEQQRYAAAANYVYVQLQKQTLYPEAGNLWLHSQKSDGTPRTHWQKWNICLDGIYMSQMYVIRLAESIDLGKVEIRDAAGDLVTSAQLWDDVYSRLSFVMENMRDQKTGLLNHGYCVASGETNNACWSRGMGWYTMVLMEAAEKMPDQNKQKVLAGYFESLMCSLVEWQDPNTFLWYNVTDGREEYAYRGTEENGGAVIYNMPETSGSAMFAYCLLRGYHNGLLQREEYHTAGMRAFNCLVETKLTPEGLKDIYTSSSVTSNKDLYQRNGYTVDDGKGVGPFLLAARYAY